MKNINYKIANFNDFLIKIINKFLNFKKFNKIKISKISNFNKILILIISFLFIYLFYLSIPTLYDKGSLQKSLTKKILNDYGVNISFSSEINYLILPSPHILIKDAKIFDNNVENPSEISQIKKLKVFISQKNFFNQNKTDILRILIQDANFTFKSNNLIFIKKFINKNLSKRKIKIKNSKFFYKDGDNKTVSIISIINKEFLFNKKNNKNEIFFNGEIFTIPFTLKWFRDFTEKNNSETISSFIIKLNKLNLLVKNETFKEDNKINNKNTINVNNMSFVTNYSIDNNSIVLDSNNSKMNNKNLIYNGNIDLNPFNLDLNFFLDEVRLNRISYSNPLLKELLKLEMLYDKNLSANIILNILSFKKNRLFNDGKLNINFNNGKINLDNSILNNNKVGSLNFLNSSIGNYNNEPFLKSNLVFKIKNIKNFHKIFQVPKKNRNNLKNIFFTIEINLFKNQIEIKDLTFNNLSETNDSIKNILDDYNSNEKNNINNWIDLKVFTNKLLNVYSG